MHNIILLILWRNVLLRKTFQYSSRTFSNFSFLGLFQASEFIFHHFPSFQAFPVCVGTLGGKPLKYLEGVTVFSWVHFSPQYILGHKVRETKPSEVLQMLALKVFALNANKTNIFET